MLVGKDEKDDDDEDEEKRAGKGRALRFHDLVDYVLFRFHANIIPPPPFRCQPVIE